jgi:predicted nucleic acid-binding Zn ribbon protein
MPLSFLSTRFIRQKKVASISQQEFMEESLVQLAEAAGWPSADVLRRAAELQAAAETGRLNATPKPRVPPEVRRAIAAANLQDMALYEYAVQLFLRRSLPP